MRTADDDARHATLRGRLTSTIVHRTAQLRRWRGCWKVDWQQKAGEAQGQFAGQHCRWSNRRSQAALC
jgi:hypothetical protein